MEFLQPARSSVDLSETLDSRVFFFRLNRAAALASQFIPAIFEKVMGTLK